MPIYEYRCTQCDDQIEVMQKITERPLRKCGKCTGRLEKLISRTSFQLKGGGWYDSGYTKASGGGKASNGDKSRNGDKSSNSDKSSGGEPSECGKVKKSKSSTKSGKGSAESKSA